ncbi:MAG TPA: sulfotransferase [Hyphomicrobiales bacterium]|nr:sulfotransferase [Hyphomicrobiales bacterium]
MLDLPCFIGGFRSGTTLLINLLGMHPALVPWFETKELCELLRWLRVREQPGEAAFETAYVSPPEPAGFTLEAVHGRMLAQMRGTAARQSGAIASGKASHERYPLGNDWVRYSLNEAETLLNAWRDACADASAIEPASAALIQALGRAQCAGAPSSYWVNKTPEISRFAPQLRRLLGPCRVLYMVRNGLEVVASASRLGWGQTEQLAYNWKALLELTRTGTAEQAAHYLELRYETLLAAPAATLDQVFAFLGVESRGEAIVADFQARYGAGAFAHPGGGGKVALPAAEHARFMAVAGDLQQALGYC